MSGLKKEMQLCCLWVGCGPGPSWTGCLLHWLGLEVPEEEEVFFKAALRLLGVLSSQQHSVLYLQGPPGIMWDCREVHDPGIYWPAGFY